MAIANPNGTTNVQSRDLSQKTPEDIAEIYKDAYDRIGEKRKEMRRNR